jgi:peptidoglycan/xylan/chitin deacetylase (PgdA/CDA1 family)
MVARRGPLCNRSRAAVFLCYHSVADHGPPFLSVGQQTFQQQLETLKRLGFRSGGQDDLERMVRGQTVDGRLAFLTFDDGYLDNYAAARPLLDAYGFRALIFLLPPRVDRGDVLDWPRVERHVTAYPEVMQSLTWPMVESMAEAGHEFGSHTLSHPMLTQLGDEQLRQELFDSRARIKERLGRCDSIAYPFGDWAGRVAEAAADAGYSYGFTLPERSQLSADRLTIPRISVDHRDGETRFRRKLTAAYRALSLSPCRPLARRVLRRTPAHKRPVQYPRRQRR